MESRTHLSSLVHLSIRLPLIFKHRIPTKRVRAPRVYELSLSPALEQDWFLTGSRTEGECTDSVGGLVWIGEKEVVEAGMAEGCEEVFAREVLGRRNTCWEKGDATRGRAEVVGRHTYKVLASLSEP